jgi:hypothetical protein
VVFAEYMHLPPRFVHAESVSVSGGEQRDTWHPPPRHKAALKQAQEQPELGRRIVDARERAAWYWVATPLFTAAEGHSHPPAGHCGSSPTATQSESTVHDWS